MTFDQTRLQALRTRLRGKAFVSGDDGYDTARQTWNATTFDQRPAIVVMPAVSADVVEAVTFARMHDLPIGVQAGGHGHPAPVNDALLVNFANMSRVEIAAGAARVEAGACWRDVVPAAHVYGLAPLNGFSPTVGVAGYLLGGGIGWLARQYGPAAGSLRSAEVVTADGRLLQVGEQSHPDLFWGLRGGGGNFGIVTSLEFDLFPVRAIFGGTVIYPIAQGRDALKAYVRWTKTVPDQLTSAVRLMHFPPVPAVPEPLRGTSAFVIMACYNGTAADGEALLKPMRALGTPIADTFGELPYSQIGTIANDPPEAPPVQTTYEGASLRDLSDEVVETLFNGAGDRASGIFLVEIRHLGGVLARRPADAIPFNLREPSWFMGALTAAPSLELLEVGKRSLAGMMQALKPALTGELMINALEAGNTGPEHVRACYTPDNYRRLVTIKDTYDPTNVFRFNHNIAPSLVMAR